MGRSDYNSGLRSSARSALHNNNSETSTGSRGAWGRPLSAACHTDNTTGSGGALGLNSLTLESNTNEGNSNGNSMNDMDNSDNGDVTVNPPDVAQAIQTRLTQYKKQKKSILTKMMRSQQNVVLNFSRLGVVTLDEETVSEMIRGKVEKLTLSENKDTLLIVPEPLVRGLDGGQQPLSTLQHLDLSQCHLSLLGAQQEWNLPNLTHLDLSKNRLRDFPSAVRCGFVCLVEIFLLVLVLILVSRISTERSKRSPHAQDSRLVRKPHHESTRLRSPFCPQRRK
mmetsp:Transcript_23493/g.53958  ORF Transcript_23493/g.53958 Transcript_23493/m.53958 type:complete len:281 (+) Transcript_23493:553-1395(+)